MLCVFIAWGEARAAVLQNTCNSEFLELEQIIAELGHEDVPWTPHSDLFKYAIRIAIVNV